MVETIFLAGAGGAVGRRLSSLLVADGYRVVGTTRSEARTADLAALGVIPVIVDVFDRDTLTREVRDARPQAVIHQLTDLAAGLGQNAEPVLRSNARLRREGTPNLVHAAIAAGAERIIAQSIAWAYAPGNPPYREEVPLDEDASGMRAITIAQGIVPLERSVLTTGAIDGIVLRYGELYGPGTWTSEPSGKSPVHVDAAALAARLAIHRGTPGPYNIADPGAAVCIDKEILELGFQPDFRLPI